MEKLNIVLLKKSLTNFDSNNTGNLLPDEYAHWIALGHFDDIFTYQVDKKNDFFTSINKDKVNVLQHNDEVSYYHPLYLVPYGKSAISVDEHRWFIAIVRIHFLKSTDIIGQFNKTCDFFNERLIDQNMNYQIYYATEFSDMVLEIQSDRLDQLLELVLRLRNNNQSSIGKTYTYFGINAHLLYNSPNPYNADDKINLFSMRFSGYNIDILKKQIELVRKHLCAENDKTAIEYCINGIDDIMCILIFKNQYTHNIIDLYKEWLFSDSYKDYKKSESSTRLGIEIDIESTASPDVFSNYKPIESVLCADLPELCKKIQKLISVRSDKAYFGWFHAISEIANSLVRMSKTPIMDEIVYLVSPGVRTFLLNVYNLLENNLFGCNSNYSYLYDYVESCSYYIEQLMRIEGQLSHNPEIRPVIYDIPVFMLEYTIAFLNKVSKLLKKNDGSSMPKYTAFLLVPRPCERASAIEIFSANDNLPGLVHIQIPESILYTPKEIFRSLCHEISHYVGEHYRNREKRKDAYVHAMTALFVNNVFNNNDDMFFDMIKSIFIEKFRKCDLPTISQMHESFMSAASDLVYEDKCAEKIFYKYIDFATNKNDIPTNIQILDEDKLHFIFEKDFESYVSDIDILFREVFADICMLYILGLESNDYINSLLYELEMYPEPNNISEEIFAIRIFVTLTAMKKNIQYIGKYTRVWDIVYDFILKISEEIEHEINGKYQFSIPINSIYALLEYSRKCFDTISKSLSESDVYDVRKMYTTFSSDDFRYKDILEEIDMFRKDMIDQYNM